MDRYGWMLFVLLGGALLPIQAAFNGRVGKVTGSPEWAVMISFLVGFIGMGLFILFSRKTIQPGALSAVPAFAWSAGILGVIYVLSSLLGFQRLGAALTFSLIVTGQLIVSLLLDHFKILVPQQHSFNIYRLAGILLIIAGVVLIRRF